MNNETHETIAESNSELLRAIRRTALRGAGFAGLLAIGGSASAHDGAPETTAHRAQRQTTENDDSVPVDYTNYVRAQTGTSRATPSWVDSASSITIERRSPSTNRSSQ